MSIKQCINVIKAANKDGSISDEAAMDMLEEINDFIENAKTKGVDNLDDAIKNYIKGFYVPKIGNFHKLPLKINDIGE